MTATLTREEQIAKNTTRCQRESNEAIEAIKGEHIVTVWQVSYEQKEGRKWVARYSCYLNYLQAKSVYEGYCSDSFNTVRKATINPLTVFTHVLEHALHD